MRPFPGAFAHILAAALLAALAAPTPLRAHEGDDHAASQAGAGDGPASPRVVAVSEAYQLVGIVEGEVLVVYLDRAADNAPVTSARIEVSLNGQPFQAEPLKNGTYEVTAPLLVKPGEVEVVVSVAENGTSDLLVGALSIPRSRAASAIQELGPVRRAIEVVLGGGHDRAGLLVAGGLGAGVMVGVLLGILARRRAAAVVVAGLSLLWAATGATLAHEGHDHGADIKASSANSPQRRPDGSIFLPKPTQRLLEIRTAILQLETATRAVRLTGRVAANPNFSGVAQSTISGRYEAPDGGVPPLGTRVKAGDLLGRVAPSFASIDSSDMAQTLGDIEQKLAIVRAKLARQEQLLRTNVVAAALVDETRMEVDGLLKRRADLLAARVRAEDLRAPVAGVIAISRAVSGQVVAQSDRLFEIVDPSRVLVEALVFDQVDPDAVTEAAAQLGADATVKLRLLGRSRALQQQYTLMQFEVVGGNAPLSVGMPATVIARTGAPVSGLFVPRSALAQAPNGQTVVFEHREPEVFVPRAVRTEPFDSQTVLVTGGLEPGVKVVVRNAPLVNQVR
jgi:hypothetical protein